MDDMDWWVWLIIAVAVIAIVAALAMAARRKAAVRKAEHNRHRAGQLREEAQVVGVDASRREADAAAARAEAEEARVAAEQLERQAHEHESEAGHVRERVEEQLAEADRIDPDAGGSARHRVAGDSATDDRVLDDTRRDDGLGADPAAPGEHVREPRRDDL